jgi:Flp pilus assembly protein TadG
MRRLRNERGTALLEAAITIPILLLIAVGIFEFGRAYQTWQVLTNAAREGARIAVLPNPPEGAAEARVRQYMEDGALPNFGSATVDIVGTTMVVNGANVSASQVTIGYPFQFIVLGPVAKLVNPSSTTGSSELTMQASALMRNESPF